MAMAMLLLLRALAHKGQRLLFRQILQQPQSKLLPMVFDRVVVLINRAVGEQFILIPL